MGKLSHRFKLDNLFARRVAKQNAKHGNETTNEMRPTSSSNICQDGLTTDLLSQIVKETALKLSQNAC